MVPTSTGEMGVHFLIWGKVGHFLVWEKSANFEHTEIQGFFHKILEKLGNSRQCLINFFLVD